jgi:outer membrane protein OmpA-like peptidoglycan-associated protein
MRFDKHTLCVLLMFFYSALQSQSLVIPLSDTLSVNKVIKQYFIGKGVGKVSNIKFRGDTAGVGIFMEPTGVLGIKEGLLLTTGIAEQMVGPNSRPNAGANLGGYFFSDEHLIANSNLCDGISIEFDFVPNFDSICFDFVFGSDEYPEFVGKEFNDLFGFYVWEKSSTGKPENIAVLPNKTYINVNSINQKVNSDWYIDNNQFGMQGRQVTEWDGYTRLVTTGRRVKPGVVYKMKMVITDITDCEYDSGILLRMHSFRSLPMKSKPIKRNYYFNFEYNEAFLDEAEKLRLNRMADSLSLFHFDSIIVFGHTDSVGNADYNYQLSLSRALGISQVLQAKLNTKVVAKGMGNKRPLADNKTHKGRALNRRVEIIYYQKPE